VLLQVFSPGRYQQMHIRKLDCIVCHACLVRFSLAQRRKTDLLSVVRVRLRDVHALFH